MDTLVMLLTFPDHSLNLWYASFYFGWQELAAALEVTTNVVEATNRDKLYENLEDIQNRLSLCEKALAEYLDTKRLAFPRFYFVSSADLLDILSNGKNGN